MFDQRYDEWIEDQVNDSQFRILKINKCCVKRLIDFLSNNKQFRKSLVTSSHLFLIIIEIVGDGNFDDVEVFDSAVIDIFKESRKPFLIELCYGSNKFARFIFRHESFERLPEEKMFALFGMNCVSESLGECNFNLPTSDNLFNNEQWQWEPLAIRLMKTFDYKCDENFDKEILKKFVSQSNLKALQAYLDLPIIDDGNSLTQTLLTTKAANYKYENDKTLLFFAANGDIDVLQLLLRIGVDVQVETTDNRTASDDAKVNENLKLLLENDARFPYKFHETYENLFINGSGDIKEGIRKICKDRQEFHAAIRAKDTDKIKSFKKEFPCLKFAYTFTKEPRYSKAATTTALEVAMCTVDDEDYTMYFLLLDEGFRLNEADLDYKDIRNANKNKINALTLSRLKREQPSHITFLMAITKIYGVHRSEHDKYAKEMHKIYRELDSYGRLTNLLKLLQHSKSLIVSVDFRNRKVNTMDLKGICKGMDGVTYHELGRIYVSAAGRSNEEIAGLLMHELTHYVLHIVFNNGCKPYYKSSDEMSKRFNGIIQTIQGQNDSHVVVSSVFSAYPKMCWPKELIVTVTQMIAFKVTETELAEKYADLFKFFTDNVLPVVDKLASHPEEFLIKREVQQLNEFLGHSKKIEDWNIWPHKSLLPPNAFNGKDIQLVVCDTPRLCLADFYNSIVKPNLICSPGSINDHGHLKDYFILASLEDFKCSSKTAYIKRIWNLTSDVMLLINCDKFEESSDRAFADRQCEYFDDNDTSRNLVAFGREERTLRSIFKTKTKTLCVEYAWKDLEQSSRARLLATEIYFQGVCIKLNKLIDDTFSDIPVKKLINSEPIVIGTSKVIIDNYDDDKFVERSFTTYRNVDQILSTTNNGAVSFLLSGEAGTGKSTMLSRITLKLKDMHPLFWVTRINLHEHVVAFADKSIDNPLEMVLKYFVKTESTSLRVFEQKLFRKLYEEAKVILLLDAVDEIAPRFVEEVLTLIENLSQKTQLWITTRPHLTDDLKQILSTKIILEFNPFSREDQLKCATRFWRKELNLSDEIDGRKLAICAENIISLFTESINEFVWKPVVGAPLLTSMIAETYLKYVHEYVNSGKETFALPEHIDIFDLFKEFVAKKICIVNREKGILAANEKAENEVFSHDTIAVFERFALKFIFERNISADLNYVYHDAQFGDRTLMIDRHNIQRCGLVVFSANAEPYFIHKTFAEFFVANFIVKSLKNASYASDDPVNKMFKIAMDILCKNVVSSDQEHFTLMKFIDGGMKYLWDEKNEQETLFQAKEYFSKSIADSESFQIELNVIARESFKFMFKSLDYVLNENAIVLLQFFLKALTRYNERESLTRLFDDCSIFWRASEMCVRSIVEHLWQQSPLDIFMPSFLDNDSRTFTALQLAFMNFPQNSMDVLRDITNFDELNRALSAQQHFDELLHETTTAGKYERSTLKLLVGITLDPEVDLTAEEKRSFIYDYELPSLNFDYAISEEHFDDFIERKWMAMEDLEFPIDNWHRLVNETIFENVIRFIFNEFNNNLVLRFYKWAKSKVSDHLVFKVFVAETFSKYFWNCRSDSGVNEVFDFIRSEVDLKTVLQHQKFADIFNEICEQYLESALAFTKNFPICQKYFTNEEFEIILFKQLKNDEGNFISKMFDNERGLILENVLLTISPLSENEEFVRKTNPEVNPTMLFNLLEYLVGFSRYNVFSINRVLNCMEKIASPEHIRAALLNSSKEENLFHIAATRRDLSKLQMIWNLAKKQRLSDKELEGLLLATDAEKFPL